MPCSCRGGTATRRGGVCSVPWLLRHSCTPLGNGPPAGEGFQLVISLQRGFHATAQQRVPVFFLRRTEREVSCGESRRRPPSTGSDSTRCSECTEPSTFHWQQNRSRKFASSILSTTRRDLPCLPRHPATAGNAGWVQLRRSTRASCCHEASAARCQTGQVSTSNPSPGSLPSWNYAQKRHEGD